MSASTNDMPRYRYSKVLSQWYHSDESGDAGAIVITEEGIVISKFYCMDHQEISEAGDLF